MTREDVAGWLADYIAAWRSYDTAAIRDLFTEDASYRYHPWGEPVVGRDAIAASWQDDPDESGSWTASYEPWAIEGDRAVAVGSSHYDDADGQRTYHNAFLCTFAPDGRCREFTEFYLKES